METINETFLKQTAFDYDMRVSEVRTVYESCTNFPYDFYEKLEIFIKKRAESNN